MDEGNITFLIFWSSPSDEVVLWLMQVFDFVLIFISGFFFTCCKLSFLQQAEIHGFTPEELNLATNLSWQDPKGRDPVQWLKEEWSSRLAEVIGKVTEMTSNENDCIGNLSTEEAKQALVENDGSVQSACKSCIESRREKVRLWYGQNVTDDHLCVELLENNTIREK